MANTLQKSTQKTTSENFLKVLAVSSRGPIKISTLGIGLLLSLAAPAGSLIIIPLSLVAVFSLIFLDLNNDEFVRKTLENRSKSETLLETLDQHLKILKTEIKKDRKPEVQEDLVEVYKSLTKTRELLISTSPEDLGSLAFIQDFLPGIVQKLIRLSSQEETAQRYLEQNTEAKVDLEIKRLENLKQKSKDEISIGEYQKALESKKEQLKMIHKTEIKLERINSYLTSITAALEQTNSYITKVNLKDENYGLVDQTQYLTESLKQITTDFEDLNLPS